MNDNKNLLKLTISKVDAPVFDGEVVSVQVPGVDGEMEILANHEALISPLKEGIITITKSDGKAQTQEIKSGTIEISHNHATILI
jgi:F-type H+-transporting ATPase subunit epsilon